jgi:hypothetical protein
MTPEQRQQYIEQLADIATDNVSEKTLLMIYHDDQIDFYSSMTDSELMEEVIDNDVQEIFGE